MEPTALQELKDTALAWNIALATVAAIVVGTTATLGSMRRLRRWITGKGAQPPVKAEPACRCIQDLHWTAGTGRSGARVCLE